MAIDTNADFTPTIPDSGVVPTKLPYNPTGSFKFWAQKVIPLVYDDSLSYYEVLCKLVTYLNNVIQNVDSLNDSVNNTNQSFETLKGYVNTTKDTLINTYNELQDYVNTYFDNLDVQEEINAKLDAMAESGELTNLLAPFIPDLVTQWLNNHVTPTSPIVDNTLSISGAAADAKVTGNKFTDLKEDSKNSVVNEQLYGASDALLYGNRNSVTRDNVTFTFNPDGSCTVNGTPSKMGYFDYYASPNSFPDWIIPGIRYNLDFSATNVHFRVRTYTNGVIDDHNLVNATTSGSFIVPEGKSGIFIRLAVDAGQTANETVDPHLYVGVSNSEIVKQITELKSMSENLDATKKVLNLEIINFTKGAYINTTVDNISDSVNAPKANASWEYAILNCAEGDTFVLNCNGANNPRPYAFADTAYNVLLRSDAESFSGKVTAPKNSAYLVVNKLVSNQAINFIGVTSIESLKEEAQYYAKNIVMPGHNNMIWSWWIYPQVIHLNRIRNQIIWGYTTKDGYKGVASYNITTKEYIKNNIAKAYADDHNSLAVFAFDNGTIVAAYSTGHNQDNFMHVRLSSVEECIEHFKDDIPLLSSGNTSYCQLLYGNNTLYMFYRVNATSWAYRKSNNYGKTWSSEVVLITSPVQYYCKFAYTTTDNVFRVLMYSNPSLNADTEANIRQAFFHLDNDSLYDSDNATVLGTSDISKDNVTVLIPVTSDYVTQRLLDVAITDIGKPLVLFVPIPSSGIRHYTIYDSGNRIPVAECGKSLFSTYVLGASWVGTEKIILSNGTNTATDKDNINIYSYVNGDVSLIETLYSEIRGELPIRNARPISDKNGDSVLWFRGYYGDSFKKFNTDAMLHIFD